MNKKFEPTKEKQPEIRPRSVVRRCMMIMLESCAVIFLIAAVIVGSMLWRIKSGPFDVNFAKPYIEQALYDSASGTSVTLSDVSIYWPDLTGSIYLNVKGANIFNRKQEPLARIEEVAIALSRSRLLIGKIYPKGLVVVSPSLKIIREKDNTIDFGFSVSGEADPKSGVGKEPDVQDTITDQILKTLAGFEEGQDTGEAGPLSGLQFFEIENARVFIEDRAIEASWSLPDFDIAFYSTQQGLRSELAASLPQSDGARADLRAGFNLSRDTKETMFTLGLQNFDTQFLAGKLESLALLRDQDVVVDAQISGVLGADMAPKRLEFDVSSHNGVLNIDALSDTAFPYGLLQLTGVYADNVLTLSDTQILAKDVHVHVDGSVTKSIEGDNLNVQGPLRITIDDMPQARIADVWPKALEKDNAKEWIVDKLSGGDFTGLEADIELLAQQRDGEWNIDAKSAVARFAFSGMSADYRAPLPAVSAASGRGVFDLSSDTIDITISKGRLGDIDVKKASILLTEVVAKGKGGVNLDLALQGPLKSVFEYISTEPIDLKDALDMDVSKVKGAANLGVKLNFPTKKDLAIEEIKIDVSGSVSDVHIPDVLQGLAVSGGPFQVRVNNERYTVQGRGQYAGRDIEADWFEYLNSKGKAHKHQAKIKITADPNLRTHFGIDLSDFISGSVPLDLVYTGFRDGTSHIDVKADVSPASVFVTSFDYLKQPGTKGSAEFQVDLVDGTLKSVRDLSGSAAGLSIKNARMSFRGSGDNTALHQGEIERLAVGETVGGLDFEVESTGRLKFVLDAEFLDLRPFLANKEKKDTYEEPPMLLFVTADQMRTADLETIQYGKIYADIDGKGRFNQLEMDAIAGGGDIYLRYKPDNQGMRTFRFEADNAGAALKAFQVYTQIRGGKLVVYGEPIRGIYDRNLLGVVEMTDFKVVDAPSLARLLGAMSLPGLIELLDGEGVSFSKLDAKFDWLYRPQGGLLVLKEGRTSGNSLGLTFDGVFDNPAGKVDVSGTIIPLSGINDVIGSIPLIGDILTGGSGAIFAATYSIKGKIAKPEIMVNPLAVLAPGILRRILFE